MGEFEVVSDLNVPFGTASANPAFGAGGGNQFFIENFGDKVRLVRELPLGDDMTLSPSIVAAIAAAEAEGNHVEQVSTGWTKMREVAHMDRPMSDQLRLRLSQSADLRFWSSSATPHNKAEQGYTDDTQKVSISFPVA